MAAIRQWFRALPSWPPILALVGLLLTALGLMSLTMENSARFGQLYSWLLVTSTVGLLILAILITQSLYRLFQQYYRGASGAKLTLRVALMFIVVAMAPVVVVYYFSLQFLQRGIDSWFDVRVEESLENALELSRAAMDLRMREALKQTQRIADVLADVNENLAALTLGDLLNESDASELTLFGRTGRIIATAGTDASAIVPYRLPDVVLLQVQQGHHYVSLDPVRGSGFFIRAVVRIGNQPSPGEERILQALFSVTDRVSLLADSVRSAFDSYRELIFLRTPLKTSFILTLSLVLLLTGLAALWAAVYLARRLVAPIRDLAEGTLAVAAGEFNKQLPQSSQDELGFLVHSFNQMTRSLAQARDTAEHSQRLVEDQRAYLEAVLARLSSGVLTLDHDGRLRTCNVAASQILGTDLSAYVGVERNQLQGQHYLHFLESIEPFWLAGQSDWRQEITLFGTSGRQILMCRGSSLPDPVGLRGGHVIVFDDVTALVQAERDAAWAQVARRLAHEIKNPLTPIQLAAERIRHKYLKQLDEEQARVLDRSTHTIIQQVQAMKDMVDAFNEYAKALKLTPVQVNLNDFLTEVLYLYRDYPAGVEIRLNLDPREPVIEADKGRLRQLIHNLVKNAIEAIKDGQGTAVVVVSAHCGREGDVEYVELIFQDDGPGFPSGELGDVFEPYMTTKPKGTGLGLAIVKRIVEEHGGLIYAQSPPEGGARVVIRLPLRSKDTQTLTTLSHIEEVG